jgi:hypothetical protein
VDADGPANAAQWVALLAWWVLALTVPIALALSLWFRRRYVRAVVRLQSLTGAPQSAEPAPRSEAPRSAPNALTISVSDTAGAPKHPALRAALRLRRRVLRAQFVAGLCFWWAIIVCIYGAIPQAAMSVAPDSPELPWLGWVLLLAPSIVAWAVQGGISNRVVWFAAAALGAVVSIAFAVHSAENWYLGGGGIACVALLALMGAAFLSPAARGAGPTLVAALSQGFMVLVGLCAILVTVFPERADGKATLVANTGQAALLVLALVAAIGASWHALHRIVRSYEAKQCSERQVALNGYWTLIALAGFAMVMSMSMYEEGADEAAIWAGSAVLVCWLAFRLALKVWLRVIARSAAPPLRPLLLLRVFKGSSASEAFLDRFVAYWRFAGPVWMIGGPDLAGAQMEPTEFFAFLRRRLDRLFVRSSSEISERVGQLDGERDPDGRLRINELFCSNSTWQATVLALLERAAVVMLDLREYTAARAGTRYEIFQIMNVAPIEKVIVLIGVGDDEQAIAAELRTAWNAMRETSPNRRAIAPAIRVLRMHTGRSAEIRSLFAAVASVASA